MHQEMSEIFFGDNLIKSILLSENIGFDGRFFEEMSLFLQNCLRNAIKLENLIYLKL